MCNLQHKMKPVDEHKYRRIVRRPRQVLREFGGTGFFSKITSTKVMCDLAVYTSVG